MQSLDLLVVFLMILVPPEDRWPQSRRNFPLILGGVTYTEGVIASKGWRCEAKRATLGQGHSQQHGTLKGLLPTGNVLATTPSA